MDQSDISLSLKKIKVEEQDKAAQKIEIRFGSICPKCKQGKFDYDGLLNLICQNCGFISAGCFT